MDIINIIKQDFIDSLILFILTIVISFFVCSFIKLIINICNKINKNRGIKIEKFLNEKLSSAGYSVEYIYETGFSDLEDVFCNIVYIRKDGKVFLRYQFNPVKFYFSKQSDVINHFLGIVSRHEKKNVIFLKELLEVATEEYLRRAIDFTIEYSKEIDMYEYIEKHYGNISYKKCKEILHLYKEKLMSIYMSIYSQLYLNAKKSDYKTIKNLSYLENYEGYEGFNYKLELEDVLPQEDEKLIKEYSYYLCDIIDHIYVEPKFDNILDEISKEMLKEAV